MSATSSTDITPQDTPYHRWEDYKHMAITKCILPLSHESHKGSSGRIAVLGGSELYTGAPYFAGMAALRTGADLLSVYTAEEATLPLKCYTPDFMVHSVYSAKEFAALQTEFENYGNIVTTEDHAYVKRMIDLVVTHLQEKKMHCCVIGPGLGRHPVVLRSVARIIERARLLGIYLVLDADALCLLSLPQYRYLLQGYDKAVLTPNVVEYQRLMNGMADDRGDPFESVTIVQKGLVDSIWHRGQVRYQCGEAGGLKRCGGIGDVLAGTLGTLLAWQAIGVARQGGGGGLESSEIDDIPLACWTACCIVKRATQRAFDIRKRALSAQDILDHLGPAMEDMIAT